MAKKKKSMKYANYNAWSAPGQDTGIDDTKPEGEEEENGGLLSSPMTLAGIGAGANLLATGFGILAARKRAERLSKSLMQEANLSEMRERQAEFAPSEPEGYAINAATRRSLSSLANRGVLQSSMAPGVVAEATAPFEQMRLERLAKHRERSSDLRLAAAQVSSGAPGWQDFLGGALGQAGSLLAMKAGYDLSMNRENMLLEKLGSMLGNDSGGAEGTENG